MDDDPLLLQIRKYLDMKLNQQDELLNPIDDLEEYAMKKEKLNKIVLKNIKSQKNDHEEQIKWQKAVIREEYINSRNK